MFFKERKGSMSPRSDVMEIWKESTEPQLIRIFSTAKREYFEGLGEVVDGEKVKGFCNSTFGWRDGQTVVSDYGVALIVHKHSIPNYIIGVSVKDFHHPKPLTLYRLALRPNIQDWNNRFSFTVANYGLSDTNLGDLYETLKNEIEELANVTKDLRAMQSSNKDSCAPKAAMLLLLLSTLSFAVIKLFLS